MNWFTSMVSSGVDKLVDSIGEAFDKNFTSDDERNKAKIIIEKQIQDFKTKIMEASNKFESEVTERNKDDQIHGNVLTKSARPIFLYWIMFILTVMIFGGMGGYTVSDQYVIMIGGLAVTAVTFFFGSKGLEIYKHGRLI